MTAEELETRFTYHAPKPGQPETYNRLRGAGKELAELIVSNTPMCREQSLAITSLEEAIFWANAAVARRSEEE